MPVAVGVDAKCPVGGDVVDVAKFMVQVPFEASGPAEGPKEPVEVNPFRSGWGRGHVYSLLGPTQRGRRELVVCAVVAARSSDEACQAVTIRVVELAGGFIGGSLRPRLPDTCKPSVGPDEDTRRREG